MDGNACLKRFAGKHKQTGRKPGRARMAVHRGSPVGRRIMALADHC
jgi:hypothetical protein